MRYLALHSLSVAALIAVPAFADSPSPQIAAEPSIIAPSAMQQTVDWTGFYLGGQVGKIGHETKSTVFGGPIVPGTTLFDGSGSLYGLHVGYNHDFGKVVLGAEAEVNQSSVDLTLSPSGAASPRSVSQTSNIKVRLGYDAGRLLPYVALGYGKQSVTISTPGLPAWIFEGPVWGGGLDYMIGPNTFVGAQALWYDLDNKDSSIGVRAENRSVTLRLSYRF